MEKSTQVVIDTFLTSIFTTGLLSSIQFSKHSYKGIQPKVKLKEQKMVKKIGGQGTAHTQHEIVKKITL